MSPDEFKGWIAYLMMERKANDEARLEAKAKAGIHKAKARVLGQKSK